MRAIEWGVTQRLVFPRQPSCFQQRILVAYDVSFEAPFGPCGKNQRKVRVLVEGAPLQKLSTNNGATTFLSLPPGKVY